MSGITLDTVTVAYGAIIALRDVSTAFPARGLVVLLGSNGSGKSTFIDVLAGTTRPTRGLVRTAGGAATSRRVLRQRCARLHQRTLTPERMSAMELLSFASQYRSSSDLWDIAAPLDLPGPMRELCEIANIDLGTSRPITQLSGGQQRLCLLLATLLRDRPHILLDEPLAGLSSELARHLIALIREQADRSLVVVVDHESNLMIPVADRLLGLRSGSVVLDRDAKDISTASVNEIYDG
jgi:ABC-type multidrug transport system ATPase subunit